VECTIDNAFNLRDLVLKELVKIIVVYHIKLKIKIQMWYFCTINVKKALKTDKAKLTGWLWVYLVVGILSYCTLHLLKDQPEGGPTIWPKHVAAIIV
jgi:hypothetical protein